MFHILYGNAKPFNELNYPINKFVYFFVTLFKLHTSISMLPEYNKVKGVHPGAILKRELIKRKLKAIDLAKAIDEYPQTINAITKEKRGINAKLSIKLGSYFNIEKDYFRLLQAGFEVEIAAQESIENPFIGKIRSAVFWDTDIRKIDLKKHKRSIIQRILERGNKNEISELIKVYSLSTIKVELKKIENSYHPQFSKNVDKYINKV